MALLPAVCKNHQWGHTKRLAGLISFYAPLENSKDKHITSSDKAMVGIIYENCGKRFPFLAKLEEKFDQNVHTLVPDYQAKWSSSSKGQCQFGGWEKAAVVRHDLIARLVSRGRQKDSSHLKEMETAAFNQIHGRRLIEDGTLEAALEDDEEKEKVKIPNNFALLGYDLDEDTKMEEIELEDPFEVYLPVPETKEEKKKKSRASKGG